MTAAVITTLPGAGRIGLLADTHCDAVRRVPAAVLEIFTGVDLILHLGDCGDAGILAELEGVAPVLATRGADDAADDPHYAERRLIEVGGLVVGALFDLADIGIANQADHPAIDATTIGEILIKAFGRRVDVVACGATHRPWVAQCAGVLLVNPGSATLPAPPGRATAAVIECRDRVATVAIEPV